MDTIISEPMGYMLFNERMLETFLHAKKWLKPHGKMYPSIGDLYIAPFSDEALFLEQTNKAAFWHQRSFHGVNLTALENAALKEYMTQPIVDTFDIRICLSETVRERVDFRTASEESLHHISIPLHFFITQTATCHGLAFWFDVAFLGSNAQVNAFKILCMCKSLHTVSGSMDSMAKEYSHEFLLSVYSSGLAVH